MIIIHDDELSLIIFLKKARFLIYKSNRDNIEISCFLKVFKWYGVTQMPNYKI
jgi:hypothetical protein